MTDAASRFNAPIQPKSGRSRWKRRLVLVFALGLTFLACLLGGAKLFLCSDHFKGMLAERLQTALNGKLHFSAVDVGLNATSVHDVVLVEQGSEHPWAKIEHVEAETPLLKLLGGALGADQVTFHKPDVTLRFDAQNRLLTVLPEKKEPLPALPPIHLDAGTLTIAQEGREPFHLANLSGTATTRDGKISFAGKVNDPVWGAWTVAMTHDPKTSASQMNLQATGAAVKQNMLSALPFVSPKVWKQVQCNGVTNADVTFRNNPVGGKVLYRVALEPSETTVEVPRIGLRAEHASGKVVIDNGLVTITNVTGQVANGKLETNSTLDFRQPVYEHHFAITAEKLDLHLLPARWRIPSTLRGRLSGSANLAVKIGDGKPQTSGEGEGVIEQARLAMLPLSGAPIRIRLLADEGGYHFLPLLPDPQEPRRPR
jgi:uncharacterized protein involved in outer membrane biogenesis